jgi:hypothetical protein
MEEFVRASSFLKRLFAEEDCIGMFERQMGSRGNPITHERAILEWNTRGYHAKFRLAYAEGKSAREVFAIVNG